MLLQHNIFYQILSQLFMLTPGIPLPSVVIKSVFDHLTSEDMSYKSNWLLFLVLSDPLWEQVLRSVEQKNDFFRVSNNYKFRKALSVSH